MDKREKLKLLAHAAQYDLCSSGSAPGARVRDEIGHWLFPAVLPNGSHVSLLKVLQSNACENDCFYCGNRRSRNLPRCELSPEELAWSFNELARTGRAQGLFLSSAVCYNVARTMERMIATVELVRSKYAFRGYVHLKLLPGCDAPAIERAVQLANRVSVNLEAPNAQRLQRLSGDKDFQQQLVQPMLHTRRLREQGAGAKTGLTTQFVVGAAGESDAEILSTVAGLYQQVHLTRAYFSAFRPVSGTPLQDLPPTPAVRQHRLYQGDFLFRNYGFALADMPFDAAGNLPSHSDPKMIWALRHPEFFPVEVNCATREELLRVPGIGPESARRIVAQRRACKLKCVEDLSAIGAAAKRATPFVLISGRRPPQQLAMW